MLSIKQTKELLNKPAMSDKMAEKIRDSYRELAEIIFEQYQSDRNKKSQSLINSE